MYVCIHLFVCLLFLIHLLQIIMFFFPIIAVFQDSVNFLLYGKVAQSHLHIYLFSHIILHHKCLDIVPRAILNFITFIVVQQT